MAKNPFFLRVLPLDAPFCGREEELKKLISYAESNTNVVIFSPRRYGKTSLVKRVQHQLEQKGFITVYIDISGASSCDDIASMIAHGIYSFASRDESLIKKVMGILKGWRPVFTPDPVGAGMALSIQPASQKRGIELLEETMGSFDRFLKDNEERFNIVIDEFQEIAGIKQSDKIEALLRKHIQHQSNVSYFFIGSRRRLLIEMFSREKRPFYKSSINLELPPLIKDEAIDFIIRRFKDGDRECPYEIAEHITDITNCYPYYVQRLSYAVFDESPDEEISALELEAGKNRMLAEEEIDFSSMERGLAAGQKALLKALASEPTSSPFAVAYTQRHRLGSLSSIQNAIRKLEALDYIERDKDNCYRLTDPVFAIWLSRDKGIPYEHAVTMETQGGASMGQLLKEKNVARAMQRGIAEINGYRSEEALEIKAELPEEPVDKPRVNIFFSYAHKDDILKERFFECIRERLKTSKEYRFSFSVDTDVLTGEDWHDRIQEMVRECDFGLLLLSTRFLNSEYITNNELPPLLSKCLPIALDIIDLDRQDLRGLEKRQIFRYKGKAFSEIKGANQTRFINELAGHIEDRVKKEIKEKRKRIEEAQSEPTDRLSERLLTYREEDYLSKFHVHLGACPSPIGSKIEESNITGDTVHALDYIFDWAVDSEKPFFALLGDYGTGKTFTCRMLTRRLNALRDKEPDKYPFCIYIDLRAVSTRIGQEKKVPGLTDILRDAIENTKDPLDRSVVTPEDIIRLVRKNRAMIIYDGMDEKTVHFTPAETNEFISRLWGIREIRDNGDEQGKVLISCRTHYFKDVFEQNSLFLGRDREGRMSQEYLSCILLPLDDSQIREYLKKRLGHNDIEIEGLINLIESVHDLKDLAKRPYILSLITEFIPDIERVKEQGGTLNSARLYELMVQNWLGRDEGKHEFSVSHKKKLMKALALEIHKRDGMSIKTDELEDWLDNWLYQNPPLQSAYANINRETLKKDIRTATFIIREHEADFSFAHTSLQEYFLAGYIIDELSTGQADNAGLAIAKPSLETLDFAVKMLEIDGRLLKRCIEKMETIFEDGYQRRTSEICLALWQGLADSGMTCPQPKTIHLEGADLSGWKIKGLNISGAVLDHAVLRDASLHDVTSISSSFKQVDLLNAEFLGCRMKGSDFRSASAAGSRWRDTDLTGTDWHDADVKSENLKPVDFVRCDMTDIKGTDALHDANTALCSGISNTPMPEVFHIDRFEGHSNLVFSCAVSPDNKKIISGSGDNTLKVWGMETGQCLMTFKGHSNSVISCAINPDNKKIVSGSLDNTLKVWDMETGQCIMTLKDHFDSVFSCAVSPDNKRIVSGSWDETLKVWDMETGQCLMTLKGHSDSVFSCAVSPDNKRIVSGSLDNTLKVWDMETGQCFMTLKGYSDWVNSCVISPDNKRIVSGSEDNTLKVWDMETGKCFMTLKGHSNMVSSCAISPDNKRIVSGSRDNTLKVWDMETGKCLMTLKGHSNMVNSCAISPDNKRIVSGSGDNTLKVWNMETGQCLMTLANLPQYETASWDGYGQRLLSASGNAWRWIGLRAGIRRLPVEMLEGRYLKK